MPKIVETLAFPANSASNSFDGRIGRGEQGPFDDISNADTGYISVRETQSDVRVRKISGAQIGVLG